MKLCDRCPNSSVCLLDYLGTACKRIRKELCPDVLLNNAEHITGMDVEALADTIIGFIEVGRTAAQAPNREGIIRWLRAPLEEE